MALSIHELYITGGQQRGPRSLLAEGQSWYDYKKGIILHAIPDKGRVERVLEYTSPPNACAEGDPILFKSGTRAGNLVYTCTQTEILVWALPTWEQVAYISLPCFNDVHHVMPTPEGNLLVANSGLEMVMEVSIDGQVLREWNVLGEDPWQNYSRNVDYRRGISTKPHRAHPNFVFYVGKDIWTTRFELKDAICLTRRERRIALDVERVHDGLVHEGLIYFTSVDGHVIVADPRSVEIRDVIDLNEMSEEGTRPGWCRGIFIEDGLCWIGFSRIRPTKFREAVSWVRQGFLRAMPTQIACYDLARREKLAVLELEPYGLNAVFSILSASQKPLLNAVPPGLRLQPNVTEIVRA